MEPTEPLFAIIAKIVLIIIFAIIPFVFGIFVNISTKHRKAFLIAGRVVSILSAIFIAVILTVGTLYATEDSYEVRPFYIYACYFCGLTIAFLPLSTFYFITCQKTKKRKLGSRYGRPGHQYADWSVPWSFQRCRCCDITVFRCRP